MVAVSLALFIRTVLQRLTRLQPKQRVARFLCGSWASCIGCIDIKYWLELNFAHLYSPNIVSNEFDIRHDKRLLHCTQCEDKTGMSFPLKVVPSHAEWPKSNRICFFGPTRVQIPNGISICSAVFVQLTQSVPITPCTLQWDALLHKIAPFRWWD